MSSQRQVFAALIGTVAYGTVIAAAWPLITETPVLAVLIHPVGHLWALTVGAVTIDWVRGRYRLNSREEKLYRAARVGAFNRMLDVIGWNALIARWRRFDGTRSTLGALIRGACYSENAHVVVALAGALIAGVALGAGQIAVAAAIVGFGLIAHPYPIALQRQVRGRALLVASRLDPEATSVSSVERADPLR